MNWVLNTDPMDNIALSALVAAVPLFYLFWALALKRMQGHLAALSALAIAAGIAVFVYGMPVRMALGAAFMGALFGLWPVCWIVLTAIFIYNLSRATGEFEIIKNSLAAISNDRRMQALLIAFSFGAFIEGAAGFGTPVAITAAMLAGLGFNPLYAAGICLLANTAPVAFGGLGLAVIVGAQVSGVDEMALSRMTGQTLSILGLFIPMYMMILMCGWRKAFEAWPAALVSGGSYAAAQWLVSSYLGPYLPGIAASLASMAALVIYLRLRHPRESWRFPGEERQERTELAYTAGQVFRAWSPFVILSILVAAWGIPSVKSLLGSAGTFKFSVPGLDAMAIRDGRATAAVFSWNILSAAGTAIFAAALVSIPVMGASAATAGRIAAATVKMLARPMLTITAILGFAHVMNFGGLAIALGSALALTGAAFPFFAAFLGWIGVFMTGSDTSSNALFGKLQEVTAARIDVDPVVTVGANCAGGVSGKMISPQSIAVATVATGLIGKEGEIFRFTLKHSILITAVVGLLCYLQAYVFTGMIPASPSPTTLGLSAAARTVSSPTPDLLSGSIYLALGLALAATIAWAAKNQKH